jgi:hypothetical protein
VAVPPRACRLLDKARYNDHHNLTFLVPRCDTFLHLDYGQERSLVNNNKSSEREMDTGVGTWGESDLPALIGSVAARFVAASRVKNTGS